MVACTAPGTDTAALQRADDSATPFPAAEALPPRLALPALEQVAAEIDAGRQGSFSSADGFLSGADFAVGLYSSNVTAEPPGAQFVPDYLLPKSGLDGLAVALYLFVLPDYGGEPIVFSQSWSARPDQGDVYIALGNWQTQAWHWLQAPPDDTEDFPDFAPFIRGDDLCVVAVAVLGSGAFTLDSLQFLAQAGPVADLQADVDSGPAPLTVQFDASGSHDPDGVIVDFEWDLDADGIFSEAGAESAARGVATASFVYGMPGTYQARVRVTDDGGAKDTAQREINVAQGLPPVAALLATPVEGNKPLEVQFDASGSSDPDGVITDFEWDFNGNGVYNEELYGEDAYRGAASAAHFYVSTGGYEATVRVTDDDGDKDTAFQLITVANLPPLALIRATPPSGPAPLDVVFDALDSTDEGGTLIDVEWDLDGNGVFNEPGLEGDARGNLVTGTYQFSQPGSYTASVRLTDDDGAQDTDSVDVLVTNDPPQADLQADVVEGEAPLGVTFDASGSLDPDGTIVDIEWDFDGDGAFNEPGAESAARGNPAPAAYSYTESGLYPAAVRVTDNYDAQDTATREIVVHGWVLVTIDDPSGANAGVWCDLALINGHPAIGYQENTNYQLRYAYSTTPTGSRTADWTLVTIPTPGLVFPGIYISLAEVNGAPALVEHDSITGLYYHRATTATGSAAADWTTMVQVTSGSTSGNSPDLAVVDGNPAVVYGDDLAQTLVYCRSSSAAGDQAAHWSSKVTIDGGGGNYAADGSLRVIEGNPAVVYGWQGLIDVYVKYCRSSTVTGGSAADWSSKKNLYGPIGSGSTAFSLAVVGGRPAASFASWGVGIQYCLASDAAGGSWGAPVVVEVGVDCTATALNLVNGNPAISYVNFDTSDLVYSRAATATGGSAADWDGDETVAGGSTEVGNFASLVVVDGQYPAIAYWDMTEGTSAGACMFAVRF